MRKREIKLKKVISLFLLVCFFISSVFSNTSENVHLTEKEDAKNTIALINHINYVVEIIMMYNNVIVLEYRPTNREHHLGFLMSRFKGGTGYIYGKMRREGLVADIGEPLWQFDYWDNLITSEQELAGIRKYIRENPANWRAKARRSDKEAIEAG